MTNHTEQYTQIFQQGQQAAQTAVENWTRLAKTFADQVPAFATQFDAEAAVDRYFDLNEKVLEAQRDVAKQVLAAGATLASAAKA
ncbi:hypothetical protein E4P39_06705 [Blastococcus sp. CT_GayMR19]|uniref:hypothetical protein n=1 Tax=Blastococcus sp. CT_GayMR19 TaxID=2559608 RepID=UPI00107341AE|nr:hypothetical protein [Blastococcus sp. CT_GayMR19]TFV77642.1 hypothetical protein E4P39_06705 [Blastococcus sp. CT_GayMR19]